MDLDINPLYVAFLKEFLNNFQISCKMSCMIAIPHNDCLDQIDTTDESLAHQHILTPSKLLKEHFEPFLKDYLEDIELEDRKLICHLAQNQPDEKTGRKFEVNILAELVGCSQLYNYKILVIDRALVSPNSQGLEIKRSLASRFSPSGSMRQMRRCRLKPARPLLDHDICCEFLDSISQETTSALESDVNQLQSNYLILPGYLADAANRIEKLADLYVPKYEESAISGQSNLMLCELSKRDIRLSVRNYMVYLLHGKLMASIQSWQSKNDRQLQERFHQIYLSKMSVSQLGAQSVFEDFTLSDDLAIELVRLPTLPSPLAIVSSLERAMELIDVGLDNCVRLKSLWQAGRMISIGADDLIATLVFALAQVRPAKLYSLSKYLETFSQIVSLRERQSYNVATFQLVIEYVFNYTSLTDTDNDSLESD